MQEVKKIRGKRGIEDQKSIDAVGRFFAALDALIEIGKIKSEHAFCIENDINRRYFKRLREEPHRKFNLSMLALLVDLDVSGDWMLTEKGKMLKS